MGIRGLAQLLGDACPEAVTANEIHHYVGKKVAIDASLALRTFLIPVQTSSGIGLTNQAGETIIHLMGFWYRALSVIRSGLRPVYVFSGTGDEEDKPQGQDQSGTLPVLRVTEQHVQESMKLLGLMGIPVVEAPCEAGAQCAALCRAGTVWATGTEDMDALTFGTPVLLRHLNDSEAHKRAIQEIELGKVLQGLGLSMDEFIDFCILCGCDYCDTIKGIGPKKALQLIRQYRTIEAVLSTLDLTKQPIPENLIEIQLRSSQRAVQTSASHKPRRPQPPMDRTRCNGLAAILGGGEGLQRGPSKKGHR